MNDQVKVLWEDTVYDAAAIKVHTSGGVDVAYDKADSVVMGRVGRKTGASGRRRRSEKEEGVLGGEVLQHRQMQRTMY